MVDALGDWGDEGRGVAAISFGEVLTYLWSGDFRMGKPSLPLKQTTLIYKRAYPPKWNISVGGGKEKYYLFP